MVTLGIQPLSLANQGKLFGLLIFKWITYICLLKTDTNSKKHFVILIKLAVDQD